MKAVPFPIFPREATAGVVGLPYLEQFHEELGQISLKLQGYVDLAPLDAKIQVVIPII